MAQLRLQGVYKRYDNAEKGIFRSRKAKQQNGYAVENLTFTCEDGEFVGILGPSGCGKTTTLRMLAGLETITAGGIFIGETRINGLLPKDRNIGLAFEDYALYPPLTVYENLAFNMRAKDKPDAEIKKAIDYVAPLLKVEELLDMKPSALSGGQKQRVNIARAIVRRPGLLLLDEPLSHLDGKMRQQLRHEIKRMHHEIKCTTIIVTHDQMEAMSLADRIVIMKDGNLQQMGEPLEVYDNPANEFVAGFIGEPPMNLLSSVIARADRGFLFTFPGSELRIEVPSRYHGIVSEGQRVTLGVRPVDVMVADGLTMGSEAPIAIYENLGDERRMSVRVGDGLLNMTTPGDVWYEKGQPVRLEFKAEKTHLFDPATGKRLG
ncbi:MAG: ABC transporter ATP-binding protein [Synergistaceae bacterium]|jgi:multiple sugar transport system ATP-binding protein|nr:ABC transporter ATP-binding protein [Synergistaceae bacterium]